MPPQRRKSTIGGGIAVPARNPLSDEAEHTPPVSPLRDAQWRGMSGATRPMEPIPARPVEPAAAQPAKTVAPQPAKTAAPHTGKVAAAQPAKTAAARGTEPGAAAKPAAARAHSRRPVLEDRVAASTIASDIVVGPRTRPAPRPATPPIETRDAAAAEAAADAAPAPVAAPTGAAAREPADASVLTMELPEAGEGPLSSGELAQLEVCESSIDALRVAFWTAGRALQIVRDGRLYRAAHANFDDYVEKRWDMQRSYAHKLIRAWPLAARLHPVAPSINEGQIRELLPIAAAHGEDAAVTVYTTLAADMKVTANKLREALTVLPAHYDEAEAVERLRAWLRGDPIGLPPRNANVFSTAESRLAVLTRRLVKGSSRDPLAARDFAAKLRGLAELIEQQIPAAERDAAAAAEQN
ncbi:hypothetical protein ACWIGI_08875 [Nocardia sp. NPDC055321]